jgi:probable HAF family extracellular repeat protein
MNRRFGIPVAALLVLLALPVLLEAQDRPAMHSRYVLKDLGTFGGPNSFVNFTTNPMNVDATVVGIADTSIPDPFDPYCFMDCFVAHTFQWRKGVLTDLGSLAAGASSGPNGINASGVIAGISENGEIDPQSAFPPEHRAVVWKDGQIIDLGTLGGTFSYANAINNRSQVVGFALNAVPDSFFLGECGDDPLAPTQMRAFIWDEDSGLRELGTLGGPDSCGMYINKRGEVAGHSFTSFTPNDATGVPTDDPFLWKDGRMTDLGGLGGTLGHVTAINDRGQVCGDSDLTGDLTKHGFLWDRGKMEDLTPDRSFSITEGMNNTGEVVGGALTPGDQAFEAYLWRHGVLTNLGTVAGDGCSLGQGINARGQVVGTSFPCPEEGMSHAFLWEHGGPAIDLNTFVPPGSGLTLTSATSIGDGGEITGQAVLTNGEEHAFLLIPRDRRAYGDDAASTTEATQVGAAPVTQSPVNLTHGKLTPELLASVHARFTSRHRGFGLRPPKQAN